MSDLFEQAGRKQSDTQATLDDSDEQHTSQWSKNEFYCVFVSHTEILTESTCSVAADTVMNSLGKVSHKKHPQSFIL